LMQTLTIASQNSVGLRDMGVATSASTFFRQIGGTLGTAVLLSLMFTLMPQNIQASFADEQTLTTALDAAFDPDMAGAPENADIMAKIYTPIVTQATDATTQQLQEGVDKAAAAATDAVAAQVEAGQIPASQQDAATAAAVAQAQQAALAEIQKQVPVARLTDDGTVTLDFSDPDERADFVAALVPTLLDRFADGGGDSSIDDSTIDDTSFLVGADPRLSKPLLVAFNDSAVAVYWVAMWVVIVAFILSLFFKTPPLREKSALQEAVDDDAALSAQRAANQAGAPVEVDTGGIRVPAEAAPLTRRQAREARTAD